MPWHVECPHQKTPAVFDVAGEITGASWKSDIMEFTIGREPVNPRGRKTLGAVYTRRAYEARPDIQPWFTIIAAA